jgi:antagonist of KipI
MIHILKPGLTAVQDAGRRGFQRFGVVAGGAADPFALRVVNALVGNEGNAAVLEMALAGPRLQFERETLIAWCGADFDAKLNDQPLPKNRSVCVPAGAQLEFSAPKQGAMAWLAVAGGIAVPQVMGSRSTDLLAKIGGAGGRRLVAGDELEIGTASDWAKTMLDHLRPPAKSLAWSLPPERLAHTGERDVLHVVRGPEWDWFATGTHDLLLRQSYRVTKDTNRMGARLTGPALKLAAPREMISAAVQHGVVQVPPSGQPILLGADRQTIGGYPRIAVVATVDFHKLAQLRPDDAIHFREISLAEAHARLLQRERSFAVAMEELAKRVR